MEEPDVNSDAESESDEIAAQVAMGQCLAACISIDWSWLRCSQETKQMLQSCDNLLLPANAETTATLSGTCGCLISDAAAKTLTKAIVSCLKLQLQAPFYGPNDDLPVCRSCSRCIHIEQFGVQSVLATTCFNG